MKRLASCLVLLLHAALLGLLLKAAAKPRAEPRGQASVAVLSLLEPASASRRPPSSRPVPQPRLELPQAQLSPVPSFAVSSSPEATDTSAQSPPSSALAAAPPHSPALLAKPPPGTEAASQHEPARYQAAALPPEHGACSARGVEALYPAMLRERGVEGRVLLRVQVDEQGRAAAVEVQGGSGWRLLDQAARGVALLCPFLPARRGEQSVMSWVEYPVQFALKRAL